MDYEEIIAAFEAALRLSQEQRLQALEPLINEWMVFKIAEMAGTIPPIDELKRIQSQRTTSSQRDE